MPSLTVAGAAQVGGPRRGDAPCFPFDCARQKPRASTETRASVGRAGAVRQGGQKSSRRSRPAVADAGHARRRRRHALCYRMRAFGARARIRAPGPTGNRKRCARATCAAPRNGKPPATRASRIPPSRPLSSRMGRRRDGTRPARIPADARGEPRSPNARFSAGDGSGRAIHATHAIRRPAGKPGAERQDRMIRSDPRPRLPRERDARAAARCRGRDPRGARASAAGVARRCRRRRDARRESARTGPRRMLRTPRLAARRVFARRDRRAPRPSSRSRPCRFRFRFRLRRRRIARAGRPAVRRRARALRRRRRVRAVRVPCRAERRAHRAQARARRRDGRARGPAVTRAARGLPIHEPNDSQDSSR